MSFRVLYSDMAREDIRRLITHVAAYDPHAARKASSAIKKAMTALEEFPFTCRKASPDTPLLRELVIPFGASGFVALFDIKNATSVTMLAVRHQHEDDYF
ncbi:MAG: type II toxin-antitoxin system RelE/ParE family toxin [Pseudomonadota bacterium]